MLVIFLISLKTCTLFSIVAVSSYITTNSAHTHTHTQNPWRKGSHLHILTSTCYILSFLVFLITDILTRWEVMSLWFWLTFSWWLVILRTFSFIHWPFFNQVFIFVLTIELYKFLVYFGYELLIVYVVYKYFLPFHMLLFILLIVSFVVQKLFSWI